MKILHVIPSVSKVHGGPTYALNMIEKALSALGVSVTTLTTDDDGPGGRLVELSKPSNANGATRFYARKWSEFYKFSPSLLTWLFSHARGFDVIHIHALFSFSSVAAAFVAILRGVPYIVRPLGTLNSYGVTLRRPFLKRASLHFLESWILRHARAVHFTSQAEWDEASTLGIAFKGLIIPLGVDELVDAPEVSSGVDRSKNKIILFLSRLDPKKNLEGLLRAFALVRDQHKDVILQIAGDGSVEYLTKLKRLSEAEGIADSVIWAGHIEGAEKVNAFRSADIFVLPSYSENFGIAAVEALIAGKPCVIGEGVAIAEAIGNAGAGLVTTPESVAIAGALNQLLSNDALRMEMAERGKSLAAREYSSQAMGRRLLDLYISIAGPLKESDANATFPRKGGTAA